MTTHKLRFLIKKIDYKITNFILSFIGYRIFDASIQTENIKILQAIDGSLANIIDVTNICTFAFVSKEQPMDFKRGKVKKVVVNSNGHIIGNPKTKEPFTYWDVDLFAWSYK